VPRYVSVEGMLLFQTTRVFVVPSGSGRAAGTRRRWAPLAEGRGLTRRTGVLALLFGGGLSTVVWAASGVLLAMLGLARVPYTARLRFAGPLFLQLVALAAVFLAIAVWIGY
jgi:uncharacterized ion transporter superfamily protein YfcC